MGKNSIIKILFIHHSTGGNLIKEGNLRQLLKETNPNLELWDHGYNLYKKLPIPEFVAQLTFRTGLSDSEGKITGKDYNIILSNNSPKEYAEIFSRDKNDPALKAILAYDIIAFKNCFPTTKIESDRQLEEYRRFYISIRDSLEKYKDKKFILLTPPPLRRETTRSEFAVRAQKLAGWLKSEEFIRNSKNIFVFDLFGLLSDTNGMLKREFTRFIPIDSHPNRRANIEIAHIFSKYITKVAAKIN